MPKNPGDPPPISEQFRALRDRLLDAANIVAQDDFDHARLAYDWPEKEVEAERAQVIALRGRCTKAAETMARLTAAAADADRAARAYAAPKGTGGMHGLVPDGYSEGLAAILRGERPAPEA